MATTTNFGWETPDDTDLVKDGASAIRTLGNGIDTSFVDLKGGTTGQVLSKNSNTDLDFTWVAQDDSNAIQNAIVDAKGDLITATAADTPSRLAVGANDTVLTADSSTATGLKWAAPASGGMTLISSTSLSGSSVTLSSIPGTYNNLQIIIAGVTTSTANSYYQLKINNTDSGTYAGGLRNATASNQGNTEVRITNAFNALRTSAVNVWTITIYDYASTARRKSLQWAALYTDSGSNIISDNWAGAWNSTDAITSLVFTNNNLDTFNGGTILLYGVK